MAGWIKLHRKTLECPLVMIDADYLAIWVYILLKATHKDMDVMFGKDKITLHPGQFVTGCTQIAEDLHISRSKVQRVLNRYASDTQIDTQTCTKGTLISVVNWDKYQLDDTESDTQVIRNRYASDTQVNTNKNIRIKEKKEISSKEDTKKESEPSVITMPLNDGSEYPITQKQVDEWKGLYPAVDVMQELRNMRGWCLGNPSKRKTKSRVNRFINSWLSREQNRGGGNGGNKNNNSRVSESSEYAYNLNLYG